MEAGNVFNDAKTGMPWYDGMLRDPEYYKRAKGVVFNIEYMSPLTYLKKAARIFTRRSKEMGRPHLYTVSEITEVLVRDRVKELAGMMEAGKRIHMPVLDWAALEQEGRHRAVAAMEIGLHSIPVMVVEEA